MVIFTRIGMKTRVSYAILYYIILILRGRSAMRISKLDLEIDVTDDIDVDT